ncbi:MAG TPA: methylated-DNA--[protein]-cysteine S-methyltransferase [Methylocella sp.]|nr:methylated-DNA--[protein]-cysteine S-methyltransferase [Methylocella sp.]
MVSFTLFDTAIGPCALAWSERGIAGVHLPETSEEETCARVCERFPDAREAKPGAGIRRARDAITYVLSGTARDFASIDLDMESVPRFHRRVYAAAQKIPFGTTTSYGSLAESIGAAGAARAVGQALARNPFPIIVPCHRVVAAGGRIGGFSATGGISLKLKLLAKERGGDVVQPSGCSTLSH